MYIYLFYLSLNIMVNSNTIIVLRKTLKCYVRLIIELRKNLYYYIYDY